jgi:tetratricopeptide (TPR) repeat protein
LLAAQGDSVGAVREIEAARAKWPDQSCLYATLAEIHATGGRLESAQDEIRTGLAVAGPTPDLSRARAVLCLLQKGGAKAGLGHLLAATHDEPDLAFCRAPLCEAHRLLASEALGQHNAVEALAHVRAGLELEPDNPELRLLEADALIANGDYDKGLPAYEELARGGRDLGAALRMYYQKGATAALVEGRKELAFSRYLRARQLGASNEELGFGVEVLHRAVVNAQAKADEAFEAGRWNDARTELDRLLTIEPTQLAAQTQLGVVCFKLEDYAGAEKTWRKVLELAERDRVILPDPVHLKLASALHALGRDEEIKPLLDHYLATQPEGEWVKLTQETLARLRP